MARRQHLTKLHGLLGPEDEWNDETWFQSERYLLDRLNLVQMRDLVESAVGELPYGWLFKTDAVKLLHELPSPRVLFAWELWRARR